MIMNSAPEFFWNCLELPYPKIISFNIIGEKPNLVGSSLASCFEKIISELDYLEQLNVEGVIISRLIYRFKNKLNSDKGFKSLQKINHLLHNYLKLKFLSVIEESKNCVFEKKGPSRQVLEWCLVSILRFSSLLHKVYVICMDGAVYFMDRLKSGDFWTAASLCFATVSRIWTLSQYFVKCSSVWFNDLSAFLPYMKSAKKDWLPNDFKLPSSTAEWLSYPTYLGNSSVSKRLDIYEKNNDIITSCKSFTVIEDLGESISRETGETVPGKNKDNKPKNLKKTNKIQTLKISKKSDFFKKLKSKESFITFICKENVLRQSNNCCVTKHLSNDVWNEMKKAVLKHANYLDKCSSDTEIKERLNRAIKCVQYFLFHSSKE